MLRVDGDIVIQHPKVTLGWAINGLREAVAGLADGPVEQRVRSQLHQLILAVERDAQASGVQEPLAPAATGSGGELPGDGPQWTTPAASLNSSPRMPRAVRAAAIIARARQARRLMKHGTRTNWWRRGDSHPRPKM